MCGPLERPKGGRWEGDLAPRRGEVSGAEQQWVMHLAEKFVGQLGAAREAGIGVGIGASVGRRQISHTLLTVYELSGGSGGTSSFT